MNSISVNYTLVWELDFDDKYQFTKDGLCFNVKTGRRLKQSYSCGSIGYCINSKFMSLTRLRNHLIKTKESACPF